MTGTGKFVLGGITALIAIIALYLASASQNPVFHQSMLVAALFCVLLIGYLIKLHFDAVDRDPDRPRRPRFAEKKPFASPPPPPGSSMPVPQVGLGLAAAKEEPRLDPTERRWVHGALIGVLGLLSLFAAASTASTAVYVIGLVVALACVLIIFRMIALAFDRTEPAVTTFVPMPGRGERRWIAGALSGLLAILSLAAAAGAEHEIGYLLALVVSIAAVGYIFCLIKATFDEMERA